LPALTLTLLLSSTIPRQPTLINFCITWVINSISYSLTAFGGKIQHAPFSLCHVQASMISGAPSMSAVATFLVVLQIWRTFRNPLTRTAHRQRRCSGHARLILTLCQPYIVYIIFLIISVVLQIKYPHSLDRSNGLYCTVTGIPFRRWSVPISSAIVLSLTLAFEISIIIRYYSGRKRIAASFPLASITTSRGLIIRITLFNVYLVVTFSATIVFLSGKVEAWAYMIQASVPLAAFVLFATQRNVIHAWCFWLKREEIRSTDSMPPLRQPRTDDINLSQTTLPIHTVDVQAV